MTDIAKLEIRIESKDSKKAEKSLDNLAKKGGKAEKSLDKMGKEAKQAARATDGLATSSKRASRATDGLSKSTGRASAAIKSYIGIAAGIAVIGSVFKKTIDATIRQENALKQLETRLESTSNAVGLSSREIANYAAELQKATTFGDEEIIEMQNVLLTFTNVTGKQFKHATEAILNTSIALGQDLKSSALQVGKALNDPIANMGALSRSGIQFSESQKEVIKSLAETGRLAEAQAIILAELDVQMGNSARAAKDTLGGALKSLGNTFGDLFEGDSSSTGEAISALHSLEDTLASPQMKQAFATLTAAAFNIAEGLAAIAQSAAGAVEGIQRVAEWAGALSAGDIGIWEWATTGAEGATAKLKELEQARNDALGLGPAGGTGGMITGGGFGGEEINKSTAALEGWTDAAADAAFQAEELNDSLIGVDAPEIKATGSVRRSSGRRSAGGGGSTRVDAAAREAEQLAEMRQREFEALVESLRSEEEVINDSYNRRVQIVMENTERGSALQIEMLDKLKDEYAMAMSEMSEWSGLATDLMQDFVSGFADSFVDSLLEGEDAFRAFAYSFFRHMAKMIAQQILFNALSGFAGSSNPVLAVVGRAFSGAHDAGGTIPAGQFGIVGERGAEFVSGPAKVTGREDTAKMFQQLTDAVNSLQQPSQNVRVINVQEENAEDYLGSDPGERKVMNILRRNRSAVQGLVA